MKEKINPATEKPHVSIKYNSENMAALEDLEYKFHKKFTDYTDEEKRLAATTPFAMVNMKNQLVGIKNHRPHHRTLEKHQEETLELVTQAGEEYKSSLTFWFTELVQNAMDADWNPHDVTTKIRLSIFSDRVEFYHDGRPPHFRDQSFFGHKKDGSEFESMIWRGSTKRGDLQTEGRFGIGFKFWLVNFQDAVLEAEGWKFEWNRELDASSIKIKASEITDGLHLKFKNPLDENKKTKLEEYCKNPNLVLNEIGRLISGISMMTRDLNFELYIAGKKYWSIVHKCENIEGNFYQITNKFDSEINNIPMSKNMIAYSIKELSKYPTSLHEFLTNSWAKELYLRAQSSSVERILRKYGWTGSTNEDTLNKFTLLAAKGTLANFNLSIVIDKDTVSKKHYLLHSMFPIGELSEVKHLGSDSRLNILGQFRLDESRTKLDNKYQRNIAICGLIMHLYNKLLEDISSKNLRAKLNLTGKLYEDILRFPDQTDDGTKDFIKLLEQFTIEFDKESDGTSSEKTVLDFNKEYLNDLFDGKSYPTKFENSYLPWLNSFPIRDEIKKLIDSSDQSIVDWASIFIHESECCLNIGDKIIPINSVFVDKISILKNRTNYNSDYEKREELKVEVQKKFDTQRIKLFINWKPDYLPKPKLPISSEIAKLLKKDFDKEWPYWLPIPVKESGTRKDPVWKLPSELKNAVLFKNSINWQSDDTDDLVKQIYEYAQDKGIEVYELANLWEPLYAGLETIRGIDIIEGDINLVMQKSVDFVIDNAKKLDDKMLYNETQESRNNLETVVNELRDILQEVGQTKVRWPFFMQNEEGNLLMISKPDSKWNNVLLCTNDLLKRKYNRNHDSKVDDLSPNKTLWWMNGRQETSFIPLYENSSDAPELYIKNLNKHSEKITHLIESRRNRSEFLKAYCRTMDNMVTDESGNLRESTVKFSPVRYAFDSENQELYEFNCILASELENTGKKALQNVKRELPGLPSFINAKFISHHEQEWTVSAPKKALQKNYRSYYDKVPNLNYGFMRHIFRIPKESIDDFGWRNNNDNDSLDRDDKILKGNKEENAKWSELFSSQVKDRIKENFALLLRTISPDVAAVENILNLKVDDDEEIPLRLLIDATLLASHSFSKLHKSLSMPSRETVSANNKHRNMRVQFSNWLAYWSSSNNVARKLVFKPLDINSIDDLGNASIHSETKFLHEFTKKPNISAGISSRGAPIEYGGFEITTGKETAPFALGNHRNWWSENPNHGGMIEFLSEKLYNVERIPLFEDDLLVFFSPKQLQDLKFILRDLGKELLESEKLSRKEQNVVLSWLNNPRIDYFDDSIKQLINHAVQSQNDSLLLIPQLLLTHYENNDSIEAEIVDEDNDSTYQRQKEHIDKRLLAWRDDQPTAELFSFVSDRYKPFIMRIFSIEAKKQTKTKNLAVELKNSKNRKEALKAIVEGVKFRLLRIDPGMSMPWRRIIGPESINNPKQVKDKGLTLINNVCTKWLIPPHCSHDISKTHPNSKSKGKQSFQQWGFGIKPGIPCVYLTADEVKQVNNKQGLISEVPVLVGTDFHQNFSSSIIEYFQNTYDDKDVSDRIGFDSEEQKWQFLANTMTCLAAMWYKSQDFDEEGLKIFLSKLGDLVVDESGNSDDEINHEKSITFGNGGWSFSKNGKFFTTANELNTDGLKCKIQILQDLLSETKKVIDNKEEYEDYSSYISDDEKFKRAFGLEEIEEDILKNTWQDSPLAIDDHEGKKRWYNTHSLTITDTDFESIFANSDLWMDWNVAIKLLNGAPVEELNEIGIGEIKLVAENVKNWFIDRHNLTGEESQVEILRTLYSKMGCTILKPNNTDFVNIQTNYEIPKGARNKIKLVGHDSEISVMKMEKVPSKKNYQTLLQHFGNCLYVSAGEASNGRTNDGWKISAPKTTQIQDFFKWLRHDNYKVLKEIWSNYADNQYLIISGIVYPPEYDSDLDPTADLVIHKLHLLYMIKYNQRLIEELVKLD